MQFLEGGGGGHLPQMPHPGSATDMYTDGECIPAAEEVVDMRGGAGLIQTYFYSLVR